MTLYCLLNGPLFVHRVGGRNRRNKQRVLATIGRGDLETQELSTDLVLKRDREHFYILYTVGRVGEMLAPSY